MSEDNNGNVMPSAAVEANLQDVIADRKAKRKQKAEEKRQLDLQRIKNMKSTTGIDPLQRFPKEVWELIFNELDPEDRGNAYQLHPLFRDLLEKNRVRDILLPQVFKVKEFQYSFDGEYDLENYSKLRRISKSMRNAVDQWVEESLIKTIRSPKPVYSDGRLSSVFLNDYDDDEEEIKKMIACFQGNVKKRFIPRALVVGLPFEIFKNNYGAEEEPQIRDIFKRFKNDITALLELIGDEILHVRFEMPRQPEVYPPRLFVSLDEVYILLQSWANLMPNLRWLELELKSCLPKRMSVSSSVLEKYPFPHLTYLERVTFEYGKDPGQLLPPQLCNSILGANQHVKILNFEEVDDSQLGLLPAHLIRSLPLTSLSITRGRPHLGQSFERIRPMMNLSWKLKSLKLELYDDQVTLKELFQLLQKFPTLEYVSLESAFRVKIGYDGNYDYLRLPNLTELELHIFHPDIYYHRISNMDLFFSLRFLLYCEKLKMLNWKLLWFRDSRLRDHLKACEQRHHGNTLNFRAGLWTLYDSNIWNVFSSLSTVEVEVWKPGDETSSCYHYYKRENVVKGVSVGAFVKNHKCCSYDKRLENCVMLFY